MKGYLIIFEDGKILKVDDIKQGELNAADDGYCDIVRLIDCMQYVSGEWVPIERG